MTILEKAQDIGRVSTIPDLVSSKLASLHKSSDKLAFLMPTISTSLFGDIDSREAPLCGFVSFNPSHSSRTHTLHYILSCDKHDMQTHIWVCTTVTLHTRGQEDIQHGVTFALQLTCRYARSKLCQVSIDEVIQTGQNIIKAIKGTI